MNYFVIGDNNCKYPSMTQEQILAAIEQILTTGEIKDVDTGFVTRIKELNSGGALKFWVGTNAEFNALSKKEGNCLYIVADDTTVEDMDAAIEDLLKRTTDIEKTINGLSTGDVVVKTATNATNATNATKATSATNATNADNFSKNSNKWLTVAANSGSTKTLSTKGVYMFAITYTVGTTTATSSAMGYYASGASCTVPFTIGVTDVMLTISGTGAVTSTIPTDNATYTIKARLVCAI